MPGDQRRPHLLFLFEAGYSHGGALVIFMAGAAGGKFLLFFLIFVFLDLYIADLVPCFLTHCFI
jgi:hypothetical protein